MPNQTSMQPIILSPFWKKRSYQKLMSFRNTEDAADLDDFQDDRDVRDEATLSFLDRFGRTSSLDGTHWTQRKSCKLLWILGAVAIIGAIVGAVIIIPKSSSSPRTAEAIVEKTPRDDIIKPDDLSSNDYVQTPPPSRGSFSDPSNDDKDDNASMPRSSSARPTMLPSAEPSSPQPSTFPTLSPLPSAHPSYQPTQPPTQTPSAQPSTGPSFSLSSGPLSGPSSQSSHLPTEEPSDAPTTEPTVITYQPGNLTKSENGLMLSSGLSARILATAGEAVQYFDGSTSDKLFHELPDGAATYADTRANNSGGWIYVSNSEVRDTGLGGVGAVTFDMNGQVIDYSMILQGSTWNCGGGRTPWNTWVSCEEVEFDGQIYQVDPTGQRPPEIMTLGQDGGRWEAFAYDVRNESLPYFFATEDHNKGTVRRFTPDPEYIDWLEDPWTMLHAPGTTDFLMLHPNSTNDGGSFSWTDQFEDAKNNARAIYPQTEGIDVHDNEMFFVCKRIQQMFVLDMDRGTYWNRTTVSGLFDGKPDQMQRILGNSRDLMYFTEEGGKDAGVHARDESGQFYTILESPVYSDETAGLAFSPDAKHLYVAFQENGLLFDVFREDGLPFPAQRLDVKYHATTIFSH